MQVPSAFFNPFTSWRMLWVPPPSSFLSSSDGCYPCLSPRYHTAQGPCRMKDELGSRISAVISRLGYEPEGRFPIFNLLIWNLEVWEEDICMFNQISG
jgi:hypothetical protein